MGHASQTNSIGFRFLFFYFAVCLSFMSLFCHRKMKESADVEVVKQKAAEARKGIEIEKFKGCFDRCKKRHNKFFVSSGGDFEGN